MELQVLLWVLGGGFTGTWGLCIFFMNRTDNAMIQMKTEIRQDIIEIRREISELHKCVKDHHSRISLVEHELEIE